MHQKWNGEILKESCNLWQMKLYSEETITNSARRPSALVMTESDQKQLTSANTGTSSFLDYNGNNHWNYLTYKVVKKCIERNYTIWGPDISNVAKHLLGILPCKRIHTMH